MVFTHDAVGGVRYVGRLQRRHTAREYGERPSNWATVKRNVSNVVYRCQTSGTTEI